MRSYAAVCCCEICESERQPHTSTQCANTMHHASSLCVHSAQIAEAPLLPAFSLAVALLEFKLLSGASLFYTVLCVFVV
jgi:hypothetical protein